MLPSNSNTTIVSINPQLTQLETNLNEHSNTTIVSINQRINRGCYDIAFDSNTTIVSINLTPLFLLRQIV